LVKAGPFYIKWETKHFYLKYFMKKLFAVILLFLVSCSAIPKNPHPELNRTFRVGIETPGKYPY
jgi:hypothetical protein